jgi:hypothetical protein
VLLKEVKNGFAAAMDKEFNKGSELTKRFPVEGRKHDIGHGDVVIAAITSCTNTSNPNVMVAAGLLAKKAAARGLMPKPWVKALDAPGGAELLQLLRRGHARHRAVAVVAARLEERVLGLRRDVLAALAQPRGHVVDLRLLLVGDAAGEGAHLGVGEVVAGQADDGNGLGVVDDHVVHEPRVVGVERRGRARDGGGAGEGDVRLAGRSGPQDRGRGGGHR